VVFKNKVYDVAERDIPAFLRAIASAGEVKKVVRVVKKGRKVRQVEEWKPAATSPTIAPFKFYEPLRQELAARADHDMLKALDKMQREYWDMVDEEDVEILAMA
jgi:hypothetical protein